MLRNSFIVVLLFLNLYFRDLSYLAIIFSIEILLSLFFRVNIIKKIRGLKIFFYILIMTFFTQIFYTQEGKVLFKIWGIYLTEIGLYNFGITSFKMINLFMISWLIDKKDNRFTYFKEYQEIVENVIELSPKVFLLFKKKKKIKWFFRDILKEIDKNS